jgi:hypothetical protein
VPRVRNAVERVSLDVQVHLAACASRRQSGRRCF